MTNQLDGPAKTGMDWPQRPGVSTESGTPDVQPAAAGQHGVRRMLRSHKWMMLLMCVPLVLVGIWNFSQGSGTSGLLGGLLCMGMMLLMHSSMGGHGHRSGEGASSAPRINQPTTAANNYNIGLKIFDFLYSCTYNSAPPLPYALLSCRDALVQLFLRSLHKQQDIFSRVATG